MEPVMTLNRKINTRVSSKNVIANPVGVKQSPSRILREFPFAGVLFFAKILVIFYEKMQYGLFFIVAKPFCEF